ncbi:MAG: hypothetical protein ACREX3_09135 [Gammaproteobacteria bacterium]
MAREVHQRSNVEKAADIIRDAGGTVVGRTRLQKIAYFLEISGLGDGFAFEYRYYGPYSEDLATAIRNAALLGVLKEKEKHTSWGGFYSIFTADAESGHKAPKARQKLVQMAANADPIELELAATAAFLSLEGKPDPWSETKKRKSEKAEAGRLEKARSLYEALCQIKTPVSLPQTP